jgi:hypothetical protein
MVEYFAITQRREQLDKQKTEEGIKQYAERLEIEKAKFNAGGMGYGPFMYQLMINPLRNTKHINFIHGFHQYTTRMLAETPKVAFDFQFFPQMTVRDASKMGAQVEMCLSENTVKYRQPFHFEFLNLDLSNCNHLKDKGPLAGITKHITKEHAHQEIVPDVYPNMHYQRNDKRVYYVTKYAKNFFDGPLDPNRTIILPATMDRAQEQSTINVVKRYKFTPIYLPIRKYIKWESGAFNMPLPNILRALKVVAETGGDWEKAVNENVAYRHKVSIEEQRERLQHRYDEKFQAKQEKKELIKMIEDTMNKRD